jgi:hypothetical protein
MFKKIELLNKKDHQNLSLNKIPKVDFAKDLKIITLGLSEVSKLSSVLPIVISGGDRQEFIAINSLGSKKGYFCENTPLEIYIPKFLKAYPFIMVDSKEEENTDRKYRAVGLDVESDYVGENKEYKLFKDEQYLGTYAKEKVQYVQQLEKDRLNSKLLLEELKKNNLLDKRSIDVKLEDDMTKTILSDFYVVNKEKLYKLDDKILLKWAKNNWLFYIVSHIESIPNIQYLLKNLLVTKN